MDKEIEKLDEELDDEKDIDVAVIMGSDSDLPVVSEALKILDKFAVPYSVHIASAHRTPKLVKQIVSSAILNGAKVFITAAGMSAALPGVVAAETVRPVIGIPMESKALAGMDALFSIAQMPPSIPVACVSLSKAGAINAAMLALEILSLNNERIEYNLIKYREQMAKKIEEKNNKINKIGYAKYIEEMKK